MRCCGGGAGPASRIGPKAQVSHGPAADCVRDRDVPGGEADRPADDDRVRQDDAVTPHQEAGATRRPRAGATQCPWAGARDVPPG